MQSSIDPSTKRPLSSLEAGSRIDLNLLYVFDAVMVERHVTRAAMHLHMSQPAVSSALARLRRLFGDRLFVKTSRGVDPTPRALALWPRIHQMLEEVHDSVNPRTFDPLQSECHFRIALNDISASLILAHLHRLVHRQAPRASIVCVPYEPAQTEARLMRGDLDFVVSIDARRSAGVESMPLWSAAWVFCGRKGHPLLEAVPSLEAFCAAPHLTVSESGDDSAINMVDDALKQRGLARNLSLTVNQFSLVPALLKTSDLIAVMPRRFAMTAAASGDLDIRQLPLMVPDAVVHLNWHQRNEASPALVWMKQRLFEAAALLE